MDKVGSMTVVLAEEDNFAGMNEESLKWFPSDPPARQGANFLLSMNDASRSCMNSPSE
ncbi:MAG: RidA family protein [Caldimonas sp.]